MTSSPILTSLLKKHAKPSTATSARKSALKPRLERQLVAVKDLSEQPESSHVLIVTVPERMPTYFAVSSWTQMGDTMRFFLGPQMVYMCRARETTWAVIAREATHTLTEKEMIIDAKVDSEAEHKFYKELDPEAYRKAEELLASGLIGQLGDSDGGRRVVMLDSPNPQNPKARTPEEDARLKTGQYL